METSLPISWLAAVAITVVSGAPQPADVCEDQPLARLAETLHAGMPVAAVLARFEAYESRFGPSQGGVAVQGDLRPRTGSVVRILFLHDLWGERVLTLTTWFDGSGLAQGIHFQCGRESGGG